MKRVTFLILILLSFLIVDGQTIITSTNFTALTKFQTINNSKDEKFNLCLAKDNSRNKYILLIEHQIFDYSKDLMDTSGFSIQLEVYQTIKRGSSSWAETDKVFLYPAAEQPTTNSKGRVFAFGISDTLLYDIKKQRIWQLTLINTDTKSQYHSVSKVQIGLSDLGKNFFITNCSLLNLGNIKGSFDDVSKYKTKLIPLYSLFRKDTIYINKIIGKATETKIIGNNSIRNIYITDEGKYIITFQDNLASEIEMFPKKRFKYIGKLFIIDKVPFELINCNCGEYSTKETGSSGDKSTDGIINTFVDKTQQRIEFSQKGRYLEKVRVEIY
jgi:hypothetical protein